MFVNTALKTHLETSATIQLKSLVIGEWNMNMPDNIFYLGNYRYRPTTTGSQFYTSTIYITKTKNENALFFRRLHKTI